MARIYGHDEISDGLAPADKKLLPVSELPAEGGFKKKLPIGIFHFRS